MKTLQLMRALQGNKYLVLADAPLFSGRIEKVCVVRDLCKVNLNRDWHIIAYNGYYSYRLRDAVISTILGTSNRFHVLTTDNDIKTVRNYVNGIFGAPEVKDASCTECLRQLIGRNVTDATLLLWLCSTKCSIDLSCLKSSMMSDIHDWTKGATTEFDGYTSVMKKYTDANGAQLKLVIDAVRTIVDSPVHCEGRRIENANSLMESRPQDPGKLLLWLLQAIKLLSIAEKEI